MGVEKQPVESRLSSSCPSLAIESGAEGETPTPRRRGRGGGHGHGPYGKAGRAAGGQRRAARSGRVRSPSESTGESDEEEGGEVRGGGGHHHQHHPAGSRQMMGEGMLTHPGVEGSPVGSGGALHKSVSTPSMAQGELATQHASATKSR